MMRHKKVIIIRQNFKTIITVLNIVVSNEYNENIVKYWKHLNLNNSKNLSGKADMYF